MGLPAWITQADPTATAAVLIAAGLLIAGVAIACYIVSWRKRREQEASGQVRTSTYQRKLGYLDGTCDL